MVEHAARRGPRLRAFGFTVLLTGAMAAGGCDLLGANRSPGEKLWRSECASCHGLDGAGNTARYMSNAGADLIDDSWEHGSDPGSWALVVREGVFGEMQPNEDLTDAEIQLIIGYLRELRQASGKRD
jgi:mono/diheme cytochrome c family protein